MAKPKILLVDADLKSRQMLEISLKKGGFTVTNVEEGEKAIQLLDTYQPDMIISDIDLAGGMDGFLFCSMLKEREETKDIPFVFLTKRKEVEDKIRGLELGVDDYLTKPIYLKEVIARARLILDKKRQETLESTGPEPLFQGDLSQMSIVDLLQTMEFGQKTGILHLERTDRTAKLFVKQGRVIHAVCDNLVGERAVYRTLLWNEGNFRIEFKKSLQTQETINASTQGLIMEGMRRIDELERIKEQLPPFEIFLGIDSETILEEHPDRFPAKIENILAEFDGESTLENVVEALPYDDLESLEIISKLYFQGFLTEVDAPAASAPEGGDASATAAPDPGEATRDEQTSSKLPPGSSTLDTQMLHLDEAARSIEEIKAKARMAAKGKDAEADPDAGGEAEPPTAPAPPKLEPDFPTEPEEAPSLAPGQVVMPEDLVDDALPEEREGEASPGAGPEPKAAEESGFELAPPDHGGDDDEGTVDLAPPEEDEPQTEATEPAVDEPAAEAEADAAEPAAAADGESDESEPAAEPEVEEVERVEDATPEPPRPQQVARIRPIPMDGRGRESGPREAAATAAALDSKPEPEPAPEPSPQPARRPEAQPRPVAAEDGPGGRRAVLAAVVLLLIAGAAAGGAVWWQQRGTTNGGNGGDDPYALAERAFEMAESGQWATARRVADQALATDADLPLALYAKARSLEQLGKAAEAEAAYRRALEINPAMHAARLDLIEMRFAQDAPLKELRGDVEDLRVRLDPGADTDRYREAIFLDVRLAIAAEDWDAARNLLDEARDVAPQDRRIATLGGQIPAKAAPKLPAAKQPAPPTPQARSAPKPAPEPVKPDPKPQAKSTRDPTDSIARAEEPAEPTAAEQARTLHEKGVNFYQKEYLRNARRTLEEAAELDPDNDEIWVDLGRVLLELGEDREAMRVLVTAGKLNPRNPRVWNNLGSLYMLHGDQDRARRSFETFLNLVPEDSREAQEVRRVLENL